MWRYLHAVSQITRLLERIALHKQRAQNLQINCLKIEGMRLALKNTAVLGTGISGVAHVFLVRNLFEHGIRLR